MHKAIGSVLLVLPFALFVVLIGIWPVQVSPDAVSLEKAAITQSVAEAQGEAADAAKTAAQAMPEGDAKVQALKKAAEDKERADLETADAKIQVAAATARLKATGSSAVTVSRWQWLDRILGPSAEIRLLLLVMTAAAIGSSIQAAKSFAAFTGRNEYNPNWNWWYFLRFPTGIGIALLMYCVIRGGFMPGSLADQSVAATVNPFGVAGISALSGMFAREASDKLAEIFGTLFKTSDDSSPVPVIESVDDVAKDASGKQLELTVKGKAFKQGLAVHVDDAERKVLSVADTSIIVQLLGEDVATIGVKKLKVTNKPGGKFSEKAFNIVPAVTSPAPVTLVSVTGAAGTTADVALAIIGTGFVLGAKLVVGAKETETKFTDATKLEATVPRADLGDGAKAKVKNPSGTLSNEVAVALA